MIYLTLSDIVYIGQRATGSEIQIRDPGLLESALARPRATAFGCDAYASLEDKAAALVHSLARNHALIDGNKRLALAGLIAFLGVNGRRLTWSNGEAYEFIIHLAAGRLDDVAEISDRIRRATVSR